MAAEQDLKLDGGAEGEEGSSGNERPVGGQYGMGDP